MIPAWMCFTVMQLPVTVPEPHNGINQVKENYQDMEDRCRFRLVLKTKLYCRRRPESPVIFLSAAGKIIPPVRSCHPRLGCRRRESSV